MLLRPWKALKVATAVAAAQVTQPADVIINSFIFIKKIGLKGQ